MSTIQRVTRNTGVVIVGDVIFKIISLVIMIYLARYLGTVGFGKYSFVFAYLAFFGIITDLGLQSILVREMARDSAIAPKLIGNAYIIKLILAVFAVALSMIVITLMSYPADTTTYIYIGAFTILFGSFSDLYATIFQANLRMAYNIIAKLVFKVLSAALILWIIFSHGRLMEVFIVLVFSEMVKTLISYSFSRKFVRPQFSIDFELWKYLFKAALPLALSSVIWIIYYQIDMLMLSPMQGDTAVGIYSAAHKLFEPFIVIPYAFMISLFPIMSEAFKTSEERLIKSYKLGLKYLLIIALPITIGIAILSDKIILLIYGAEFAESATVLQILICAIVFTFINFLLLNLLISINKQKLHALSMGICAIVNVILNLILIPILSYNGAAIATLVTNAVLFIASFYFVSKHLFVLPVHEIIIKPVIAGLMMGTFVYYFINVNIFLLVPLAVVIYLVALLALKTFTVEDWEMAKKVLKR
ncbi:MAG: Polysaccharide biosynthesis protein [Candidatus Argoarchaeum ethanivorans]|uniref:Polysaccharide biosynthesis protein n=1 Tax=Candidatus Argoarchaeum ethanivorans TaxID=2608793 RepID=A0A811T928_9EURY|nr:MAG: Polysaccharide biosynthesis protein [Candidatus Argoarchaeum ethanivorans]